MNKKSGTYEGADVKNIEIRIDHTISRQSWFVYLLGEDPEGAPVFGMPTWFYRQEGMESPAAIFYQDSVATREALQNLLNDLDRFGFKPMYSIDQAGVIKAKDETISILRYQLQTVMPKALDSGASNEKALEGLIDKHAVTHEILGRQQANIEILKRERDLLKESAPRLEADLQLARSQRDGWIASAEHDREENLTLTNRAQDLESGLDDALQTIQAALETLAPSRGSYVAPARQLILEAIERIRPLLPVSGPDVFSQEDV